MKTVEERVIAEIRARRERGLQKYGVGLERGDLALVDWLQHAKEEALDLALYLQRAIDELKAAGCGGRTAKDMSMEELVKQGIHSGQVVCFKESPGGKADPFTIPRDVFERIYDAWMQEKAAKDTPLTVREAGLPWTLLDVVDFVVIELINLPDSTPLQRSNREFLRRVLKTIDPRRKP